MVQVAVQVFWPLGATEPEVEPAPVTEIAVFRPIAHLFAVVAANISARRAAKRKPAPGLGLEELESRLLLSSLPLHVVGNQLENSLGQVVVLRGVNVNSLEFRPDGDNVLQAESIAINDWHANLIRLPVNEDYWFGHDEWWTGAESGDGGAAYRALIGKVISTAQAANVYVMLDLHWSDMGTFGAGKDGQHFMPDNNSTLFWQSAAKTYANNPAVLFDPYNEPSLGAWNQAGGWWNFTPTAADWNVWRNGGTVVEGDVAHNSGTTIGTYHTPGMQGLINTIRATGATNIIAPEGLNWGSDLSGVLTGYALTDPTGNLMYQAHLYPGQDPTSAIAVSGQHPIYVGEWGDGGVVGRPSAAAVASNTAMLAFLNAHNFSWTAWDLSPEVGSDLNLLTSWNGAATTSDYGTLVKADLAKHAAPVAHAPTVATAAKASANLVTGKTTSLSVLGADALGAANLTYTWATAGTVPAAVTFSANGSNAAKATTATFSKVGTYAFQVTITNAAGLTASSSVTVVVNQTLSAIAISSAAQGNLLAGATRQFAAKGLDQFGIAMATQPAFAWSVAGGGTITPAGLYKAPATAAAAAATVSAKVGTLSQSVAVTVVKAVPAVSAKVGFQDTDDWGSGFVGYITMTNTGTTAINTWTLEFDFAGTIHPAANTGIWNARVVSHVGNHYVIQYVSWNATIAAGQSVSFGFVADWPAVHAGPSNYILNGLAVPAA